MSELKHVRDPVTGRCVACETLNNQEAVLDPAFHPDVGSRLGTGAGLMTQQNRPSTPVVFDPADPNYIRAIRRGSVSLVRGQGVYSHAGGIERRESQPQMQPQRQPQRSEILILDGSRPGQSGSLRPAGGLWQAGGKVEPARKLVKVQPSHSSANLHGAQFYSGQRPVRVSSEQGCCVGCCVCCRKRGGSSDRPPKRPIWRYEESDTDGRCCKGCLVAACVLLVLLALLAAPLVAIFTIEAINQNSDLSRRYLLVYNDTLCQQQAKTNGTTLAGCSYTKSAEQVVDTTFTNPPLLYSTAAQATPSWTTAAATATTLATWQMVLAMRP